MRRTGLITLISLALIATLFAAGCTMAQQSAVAQPPEQISTAPPNVTCEELVSLAETSVGLICNSLGRNQACYGNRLVSVNFRPGSNLVFQQSGDTVNLLDVQRLQTSPLNLQSHDWGIAVLKAQANLPDSLPGENVTFLLFGDTSVDNPSPDMRAVTVSTRIGSLDCADAPESAVLIQSPTGQQVSMRINGADLTLGSTAYLTAEENKQMSVAIVEGTGIISANNTTRVIVPGMQVHIPLGGGPDGLQANGTPSEPEPFNLDAIKRSPLKLLPRPITENEIGVANQVVVTPTDTPAGAVVVTATPTTQAACTPRTDWGYRYVVQAGDNLSIIALKLNVRTADLQAGNCIDNPNRLIAGQSIMVPHPVPTNTPRPPTATPTSAGPIGPNLRADNNPIGYRECTMIRWDVDNIDSVYFEGQPVIGHDSRQVCPSEMTTYTLLVILLDGSQKSYTITINVQATCGNQICEPGESYSTCPSDCLG